MMAFLLTSVVCLLICVWLFVYRVRTSVRHLEAVGCYEATVEYACRYPRRPRVLTYRSEAGHIWYSEDGRQADSKTANWLHGMIACAALWDKQKEGERDLLAAIKDHLADMPGVPSPGQFADPEGEWVRLQWDIGQVEVSIDNECGKLCAYLINLDDEALDEVVELPHDVARACDVITGMFEKVLLKENK